MSAASEGGVVPELSDRPNSGAPTAAETAKDAVMCSVGLETGEAERIITLLEGSGQYRVLRRLGPRPPVEPPKGTPTRRGVFVDVETTGLDTVRDEIIELAMLQFDYSAEGQICGTLILMRPSAIRVGQSRPS